VNSSRPLFKHELLNFLAFAVRPTLGPRLPGRQLGDGWHLDWFQALPLKRLLQWALALWALNMLALGPLALSAASAAGAQHRLDIHNIPWLHALLWAPIVEELVFRYGLRQPIKSLWLLPFAIAAMLMGPQWQAMLLLGAGVLLCWWLHGRKSLAWHPSLHWHAAYRRRFPWVLHLACLAFAAVHLHNFSLQSAPLWLLPLMVAPQWLTGLVLAWLRVRRGIGAAIVLHAIFNGGPLLLIFLLLTLLGGELPLS